MTEVVRLSMGYAVMFLCGSVTFFGCGENSDDTEKERVDGGSDDGQEAATGSATDPATSSGSEVDDTSGVQTAQERTSDKADTETGNTDGTTAPGSDQTGTDTGSERENTAGSDGSDVVNTNGENQGSDVVNSDSETGATDVVTTDGDNSDTDGSTPLETDTGSQSDIETETTPVAHVVPSCSALSTGGTSDVAAPELLATLFDSWQEAWLGSPAVADLDGDGENEIIVPRSNLLLGWHLNGDVVFRTETDGRIWSSPVVADLVPEEAGLEVAVASRERIYLWNSTGQPMNGFPVTWRDEMRSIAAGDIDGDGRLEIVAVTTVTEKANDQEDLIIAYNTDGTVVNGFPPNTTSASECDDACYQTGGFDQNIALGDVNGDGVADIFGTQDNAYLSLHEGDGRAFDAADIFDNRTKFLGVRFMLDYDLAMQGWANNEQADNQAHFTNSAPAIADIDGDGGNELVVLGSVQNAGQTDRYRGVVLYVLENDATRPSAWMEPIHASDYLAGLWDYENTNVVGATNQVTVADIDGNYNGFEMIFAGFDGRIHAVASDRTSLWSYTYTTDDRVLTGGVVVTDLSGDGVPEIVFNSYSPDDDKSHLFVLSAAGEELHKLPLPTRGAMPVPTIADVDGDGAVEIIVSLKDGENNVRQVLVYTVPGSADNCLLWPTGRANYLRDGYVPN